MSTVPLPLLEAVPWRPDLAGDFGGQASFIELAPKVRLVFCWCPPTPEGQPFVMGSPPDEPERLDNEGQREVRPMPGFWLARHPVNQQQWQAVMGTNPSQRGRTELHPVDSVSWNDVREFCRQTGLRLPKEAEWEYACRAGTTTRFAIGAGTYLNSQMASFDGNYPYGSGRDAFKWLYRESTLPEGSFPPNAWGFHDMHGQLWEWCEDEYAGWARVLRGGGWISHGRHARSAYRARTAPDNRAYDIGFRPCPSSTRSQAEAGGRETAAERGKE